MTLLSSIEERFAFRDFLGKVAEIQETLGNLKNKAQGAESLADGVTNGVYRVLCICFHGKHGRRGAKRHEVFGSYQ